MTRKLDRGPGKNDRCAATNEAMILSVNADIAAVIPAAVIIPIVFPGDLVANREFDRRGPRSFVRPARMRR
jgi:hypothetical protein